MKSMSILNRALSLSTALLVAASLGSSLSAAPGTKNLGDAPKVDASAITVDGKKDELYDKALNIKTEINNGGISADTWVLWSDGWLYVYAEVVDPEENDTWESEKATSPWTADSIEILIDDDNDGENYGMQYRVDFTGYGTWKDRNANVNYYTPDVIGDDFLYPAQSTDDGYTAELRIPLDGKEGGEVGYNIQVNGVSATSYLVQDAWNTPEYYYFVLGEPLPSTPAEVEAAADEPAAAPQTFDAAALTALSAVLCAAGIAAAKKKR